MIKAVAPAQRHPTNRSLADFHNYWRENHGPLFANTSRLRRYVQHMTLPEAYGGDPKPTYDGVSMFWYDDLNLHRYTQASDTELAELMVTVTGTNPTLTPGATDPPAQEDPKMTLSRAVLKDDAQLFDRTRSWPMHLKRAEVAGVEHVVVEGPTTPAMVKAMFFVSKLPGLTLSEFSQRWLEVHGPLVARTPGLRRYVQNHAIPAAYAGGSQTHDGWSELWFDDLDALRRAVGSPQWHDAHEDGAMLFAEPVGVGVGHEHVQKEPGWTYNDWGAGAMNEDEIRARLAAQGYRALAADPDVAAQIKAAAAHEALAIWTAEHLVTIDDSHIDARPEH